MSAYEPGTVAVATVRGVPNVRVMAGYGTAEPRLRWVTTDERLVDSENEGWWFAYQVTDVRPLVVLDPEGIDTAPQDTIPYLIRALRASDSDGYGPTLRWLADQIEAQTRPPKPPEPTGLGAVVEDIEGERWVRLDSDMYPWFARGSRDFSAWEHIDAVRVLSEGVRP